jgi:RNA 2',3'-cyclic 3'-phosphodiesterase
MAKERLKSPRARLFVALELPDRVRRALAGWQRWALAEPALRAPASATLHVTLCFLGYVPERRIGDAGAALAELRPRPVELRFEPEPVPVPPSRPRLYAAAAPSPEAVALQAELEAILVARRLYEPEKRPFWSHVTIARVRPERSSGAPGGRRRRGRPMRVASPPPELPPSLCKRFGAVRVTLYRSILRPQGAEYASLAGINLPSRDRGGTKKE